MSDQEDYQKKLEEVRAMEELIHLRDGLPHLFGYKHYPWSRKVFDSDNKEIFLTSANQVGKSLCAVRKNIHLATSPELWPKYWPTLRGRHFPSLFWYFLPTLSSATTEVETKWIPFYLPQDDFKNDKKFGWREEYFKGEIYAINFNSGVQIQFKSYSQRLSDLQTASVYHITADEEMPVHYLPEIKARLNATDGYFLSVFTATLGQLYWKQTMEPSSKSEEKHPNALKIQVSLYDSQFYEDGTPSHWTDEKIKRAIANCPTDAEIQRRIYGKFVKSHGLRYESFSLDKNMCEPEKIPKDWLIYSGIDVGSGGQSGHPAAIAFVAVSPDYKSARLIKCWRGDGVPTDATSILEKYREMRGDMTCAMELYDFASADFFSVSFKMGENFIKADKSRDAGSGLLNTLFKTGMFKLFRGDSEIEKFVNELMTLPVDIDKRKAKDDLIDAVRYCVTAIPFDFSDVDIFEGGKGKVIESRAVREKTNVEKRREHVMGEAMSAEWSVDDELDYWNELSGALE